MSLIRSRKSKLLRNIFPLLAGGLLLGLSATGFTQQAAETEPAETEQPEIINGDPLGRDTPRGSFTGFLTATEKFDFELASEYMDLRNLPAEVRRIDGERLAQDLDFVLKRTFTIAPQLLSRHKDGQPYDGLPDYRDELGRIKTVDGEIVLLMQRVPGPGEDFIWKISNATVASVPELYDIFSYPSWVEIVRTAIPQNITFMGVELYKWLIVLGFSLFLVPLLVLAGWGLANVISNPSKPLYPYIRKILKGPLAALVAVYFAGWLLMELGLGATAQRITGARTLSTIFWIWMIWAAIDLWRAKRRVRYESRGRTDAAVLGRPTANALKLMSLILGLLVWLTNAGFDLTTVLAGLGIGGLAVALAMQKPIEDLLGAISIYSQHHVITGDFCRYQNTLGRIEEIGLRTTRIRTLANTLISVPNAQLAHGMIENITARTKILYHPSLQLRYDTSAEQLQIIRENLEKMARENPRVEDDTIRIRVDELAEHAIVVRMRIFALTQNFDEYLEIREEVNLAVIRIIEASGARFAQGARSVLIENSES